MICILIRDFAVTQERRFNSAVSDKALILIHTGQYRPTVLGMDAHARSAGVSVGMTLKQAQTICPFADVLPVDETRYKRMFMDSTMQLLEVTDRIEPEYQATSAVWYTDDDLMLPYLMNTVQQITEITPQLGIARTKFPARVAAAMAQPGDCTHVPDGDEAKFLSNYPVTLLPLDKHMTRRLPLLGIHTLGQLANLPRLAVWEQFGKHGRWLHDLANGKDVRPLSPFKPVPIITETQSVDDGIVDRAHLYHILEQMSLRLIASLDGREAGTITLILYTEDRALLDYHRQPHQPIRDSLFLLRLLTQMLDALPVHCAVQRIDVRLDNIQQRKPIQLSLFEEKAPVQTLTTALPHWAQRHQHARFYRLRLTGDDHLPERVIERQTVVGA